MIVLCTDHDVSDIVGLGTGLGLGIDNSIELGVGGTLSMAPWCYGATARNLALARALSAARLGVCNIVGLVGFSMIVESTRCNVS